jgi:hypothetical protein
MRHWPWPGFPRVVFEPPIERLKYRYTMRQRFIITLECSAEAVDDMTDRFCLGHAVPTVL